MSRLTRRSEATELTGSVITDSLAINPPALAERLESALARLETALAAKEAENLRLRHIAAAAAAALADLDALIDDAPPLRRVG